MGAKDLVLQAAGRMGAFQLAAASQWRQQRLLILCFHGIAGYDEQLWRPGLYLSPSTFRRRMELLAHGGYNVLPLGEAVARLRSRDLPPRSVVLTFDDGFADFHRFGWPVLREFGFPATVYLPTYYVLRQFPIFGLISHYLLWRHRGSHYPAVGERLGGELDLRSPDALQQTWQRICRYADDRAMNGAQKDEVAAELAALLGEDYCGLKARRLMHLMNPAEVGEVARAGIDIQLHTHRHRLPDDRAPFEREMQDSRRCIIDLTGKAPNHFCYPSGVYSPKHAAWLEPGLGHDLRPRHLRSPHAADADAALPRPGEHLRPDVRELDERLSLTRGDLAPPGTPEAGGRPA